MFNHRRTVTIILTFILFATAAVSAFAEQAVDFTAAADFAFAENLEGFYEHEDCTIRAVYSITLPEDTSAVHELILENYGGYSDILLIEFGCCNIGPIVESQFICVGTSDADGSFAILPAPRAFVAKTYDYNVFDGVSIVPVA